MATERNDTTEEWEDDLTEIDRVTVIFRTPEESWADFDAEVREKLGISAAEFARRYDAGEYDDPDDDPVIRGLAFTLEGRERWTSSSSERRYTDDVKGKAMAQERARRSDNDVLLLADGPLIGVVVEADGRQVVRYSTESTSRDHADEPDEDEALAAALAVVGAWRDLDWDEFSTALDRLRHESVPTPPIEL